ncbi:alpha-amylase family glycosyl hydrolase [Haloplasma contractile]|uniref:Maltooligosyl trehalose synthase Carbohydrate transport protein n=1 Tax=Haloplasma contractile SSD-17B TaxID=1033810 RepID=U2DY29_9MOLU|nr:alpha-amylase family glycosyl hydrolase [Haloplasma contractile]ERJ13167.1 Maltooligosyl trehalose synthase Carbohydrate transport protein [Haloplasma contractile SSD-17B]
MKSIKLIVVTFIIAILASCGNGDLDVETTDTTKKQQSNELKEKVKNLDANFIESDHHGVYYEIFVRSFADADGDGIGDFKGITEKMPYLADLGIEGIWLMPMFESPSYHGYDVVDYYNVEKDYGTMEDFEEMLAVAEQHGIDVIVDLVINHTSSDHPWFIESKNDEDSKYRDYYTWITSDDERRNEKGAWDQEIWHYYGGSFYAGYFIGNMPDLNFDNEEVKQEVLDVADFWLEKGVDGYRLDAAMHVYGEGEVPENVDYKSKNVLWWHEFRTELQKTYPDIYLVGEVWSDPVTISPYFKSLHSNFNFEIAERILSAVKAGDADGYTNYLEYVYMKYNSKYTGFIDAPFLTNHDEDRVASQLHSDSELKLAADMLFMLSGNPYIYYGEELGLKGVKGGQGIWDMTRRLPMKWSDDLSDPLETTWYTNILNKDVPSVETQLQNPNSLLNHYKNLISIRNANIALEKGEFKAYTMDGVDEPTYLKYSDEEGNEQLLLVIHNMSNYELTINIDTEHVEQIIYNSSDSTTLTIMDPQSTLVVEINNDYSDQYIK